MFICESPFTWFLLWKSDCDFQAWIYLRLKYHLPNIILPRESIWKKVYMSLRLGSLYRFQWKSSAIKTKKCTVVTVAANRERYLSCQDYQVIPFRSRAAVSSKRWCYLSLRLDKLSQLLRNGTWRLWLAAWSPDSLIPCFVFLCGLYKCKMTCTMNLHFRVSCLIPGYFTVISDGFDT